MCTVFVIITSKLSLGSVKTHANVCISFRYITLNRMAEFHGNRLLDNIVE
jgi:hypothetical protein